MQLISKYITPDDFFSYAGESLSGNLVDGDNPSDKVNAFIYRVEKRLEAYLNAKFYRNVELEYPEFTNYQKEHYKLALLEQCLYVYKNGDIGVDSGYEQDKGIIANKGEKESLIIAPFCKDQLVLCGLWCTHINFGRGNFNGWIR